MPKPNFIIAGVARCGTTSLYHYLKQHPEISFSKIKEPKYFSSKHLDFPHRGVGDNTVDEKVILKKEAYLKLFEGLNTARIGEASSDCLYYHQYTASSILEEIGDVPIIIVLRNPVDRALSAYNNLIRDNRENLSFSEGIKQEEIRVTNNWDWMWAYKQGGLYYEPIKNYLNTFSNVRVIFNDDLEANTQKVLQSIYAFLDVDTKFIANTDTRYSHSGSPKNLIIKFVTNRNGKISNLIRNMILTIFPRNILEQGASKLFQKKPMGENVREYLIEYFYSDIEKLEKLIGQDLTSWKR